MADRYWVGGTGTWDATSTANWSASSGGASGASVPTAADNVFFDAGSDSGGIFTVTMANTPRVCNDITISGLDFTMTLAGTSIGLTVSGSLTFPATNFTRTYTGTTTFNATTTGKTVTTNGVTFGGAVTFNGAGGGWTLGSALTLVGTGFSGVLSVIRGTFDTSTSHYNISGLTQFEGSSTNTRTITLNNSNIILPGGVSPTWNTFTTTGLTFNAGQSLIQFNNSSASLEGGGLTFYDVSFASTSSFNIRSVGGSNTFRNLTFATLSGTGIVPVTFTNTQTITGTLTISGASATERYFVFANIVGTTATLNCAAIAAITDVDFRDITIAGAHGTLSGTRLGDCGGNSNITFVAGANKYWNLAAGGNWTATAWATSSGGSVAATNFPLAQDTVIIENTGLTSGNTITINADWNIGTLDTSTRTLSMTLASSTNAPTFYGNFTYGSGVTPSGTSSSGYRFSNRATKTLNSGGKTFTQPVTINAPGGGIQLVTNNLTLGSTVSTTLTQGTLDLNNLTLSTGTFLSNNSNTRSIAFGTTGQITLTGNNTTIWDTNTSTNLTTTGTFLVVSNYSGSTGTRTFTLGSLAVNFKAGAASGGISFGTAGTDIVSVTGTAIKDIDTSGFTGTFANASRVLTGNLTIGSGTTVSAGTGTTTFGATSGTQLITTNGKTLDFPITFNSTGATCQLQDALTVGATRTTALTAGSLDLNNLTLSTGTFSSSNSNTRSIAFGSTGSIVPTTTTAGSTVLDMSTVTNFTFTGTSNISAAMSTTRTFKFGDSAGATTSNRLNINLTSGASAPTFTGSFRQINFTGSTSNPGLVTISCHGFTLASGGTYTSTGFTTVGDGTLTYTGKSISTLNINTAGITTTLGDNGSVSGTVTLTVGTLALSSYTLTTPSFSSSNTNTRSINFGTGTIAISATGPGTIWTTSTTTGLTISGTPNVTISSTYGGGSTTRIFPGSPSESNTISFNFITTNPLSIDIVGNIRDFKITAGTPSGGSTRSFSIGTLTIYGNLEFTNANLNLINLSLVMAATSGTKTISYSTVYLAANSVLNFNGIGGTWQLLNNAAFTSTTFTNGTVDLNGKTLTVGSAATAVGTKNLTFNGGTLVCSAATTTAWNNANPTGFTTTAGTGTGTISMTSASAKTFVGGGSTYNCTLNQGGAGTLTITGANTFNDITETVPTANQITFPASTTTTVNNFTLSGSAGNLVSLRSSTPGTRFTLSDASGTVSVSYLDIQDSNATGGATWQAFTSNGNVNSGNNLGWDFGAVIYNVSVSETATGADTITLVLVRVGTINETATGADTAATALTRVGAISETATGADTTASQLTASGAISETATGADTTATALTRVGAISETATGADTTASQLTTSGAVSETATGADDTTGQLDAFDGVDETATAEDTLATQLDGVAAIDETVIGVDSSLGSIIATLQISEGATILDAALARLLWELINDNQLPGWQLIPNNQGSGWTIINTQAGGSWTNIDTV